MHRRDHRPPLECEPRGARGSVEERNAEFAFKLRHLGGNTGLADMKGTRSFGEGAETCDLDDVPELMQFHKQKC
ncbi:hypothetical protein GCM10022383_11830 [Microbacterium soli]|uniref:Uncharacterized protein n=1 Tax=Microbacterium soli TaxID=446075 RepID=A0ABP7N2A7_9MICO